MTMNVATATTTASTMVQPKSAQPGPPYSGRGNGLSDQAAVLNPDHDPNPMNTSEPIPAAIRPGSNTTDSIGPPRPMASITSTAPITGEPKIDESAAKLPAAAIRLNVCCGASRRMSDMARMPRPVPSCDQRRLGPQHEPQPQRRERCEQNTRQVDRPERRAADLEPIRRHMPAVPRQARDRERSQQACQRQPRQRPPQRQVLVAEVVRQVLVDLDLDLVNSLEEQPRGARDEEPDQGRQDEQPAVFAAAHQRLRVGRHGCGGHVIHDSIARGDGARIGRLRTLLSSPPATIDLGSACTPGRTLVVCVGDHSEATPAQHLAAGTTRTILMVERIRLRSERWRITRASTRASRSRSR